MTINGTSVRMMGRILSHNKVLIIIKHKPTSSIRITGDDYFRGRKYSNTLNAIRAIEAWNGN